MDLEWAIVRALMAGVGVAIITGVMGCFVVWRRMAYFGDALAHSALLGIALGLATGLNADWTILAIGFLFATLLLWLQRQQHVMLGTDILLGMLAYSGLALGMVVASLIGVHIDLHAYLFGDILNISVKQLYWIYGGGGLTLLVLCARWASLVLLSIHKDLAMAEHVAIFRAQVVFMCLMALVVATSARVVGILLITAMLIIPAATARQLARSPEGMAFIASFLGALAMLVGIPLSMGLDMPSGPSVVTVSTTLFIGVLIYNKIRRNTLG